jgi:hypothetical protein
LFDWEIPGICKRWSEGNIFLRIGAATIELTDMKVQEFLTKVSSASDNYLHE